MIRFFGAMQEPVETGACQKSLLSQLPSHWQPTARGSRRKNRTRQKVIRVETAPNHLSIIELAEPVIEVAAGSSSYKIEWRGNKVFVQPLDPEATTNLFIWTASGRLSYELVPAASVAEMNFAINQEPSPKVAKVAVPEAAPRIRVLPRRRRFASEMLFASTPVRLTGEMKEHSRVEVILKDIYRQGDCIYVRYAIQNNGRSTYVPSAPGVFMLRSPRNSRSLYALSQSQLVGDGIHVRSDGQIPVKVLKAEVHASAVAPGSTTWGLVEFNCRPRRPAPPVVKFAFPPDGFGEVSALLVM